MIAPQPDGSNTDDEDRERPGPILLSGADSPRRWRPRLGRATRRETGTPGNSRGGRWHTAVRWMFRVIDALFVAAVMFLCGTLVWCGGPFERMGWPIYAIFGGLVLLPIGGVYLSICSTRRSVRALILTNVVVVAVSALSIVTGVVQKVRWAQARPAVLAIAAHPPARGQTQHLRLGTFSASVSGLLDGTVLVAFERGWDGLLYVPHGMPEPDRRRNGIGPEVMPRWWYYDTD